MGGCCLKRAKLFAICTPTDVSRVCAMPRFNIDGAARPQLNELQNPNESVLCSTLERRAGNAGRGGISAPASC